MNRSDAGSVFSRGCGRGRIGVAGMLGTIGWLLGCGTTPPGQASDKPEATLPDPLVSITSPDSGDVIFDRLGGVVVTPDSLVVVALGSTGRFLIYEPTGRLLRAVGRRGAGPGEFQAPASFGIRNDSLWVFDGVTRRLTTFSVSSGTLIGTARIAFSIPEWSGAGRVYALMDGGAMLVEGQHSLIDERAPSSVPVGLQTASGAYHRIGTRDLSGVRLRAAQANGTSLVGLQPFVSQPLLAATGIGTRFALVEPTDTGTTVSMFNDKGQTVYQINLAITGAELTDARVDSALSSLGPQFRGLDANVIRRPSRLPPVSAAIADNDGSLWLRLDATLLGRAMQRWLVLSPDGSHADTVLVPRQHQLVRPHGWTYWAVVTDSLDVPRLDRYAWTAVGR